MKHAAFATLLLAAAAGAHEGGLHEPVPVHGGQVQVAGPHLYELVVVKDSAEPQENPIYVYVTDHDGAKTPVAGASGTATLLAGKRKASIALAPDGDNRLKGVAQYASAPDMKAVVSVTLAGRRPEQARFTPLAADAGIAAAAAQ